MMKDHLNIENSVRANHGGGLQTKAAKEEFAAALKKAGVPDRATIKAALIAQRDEERAGKPKGEVATPKPAKAPVAPKPVNPEIAKVEKEIASLDKQLERAKAAAEKANDAYLRATERRKGARQRLQSTAEVGARDRAQRADDAARAIAKQISDAKERLDELNGVVKTAPMQAPKGAQRERIVKVLDTISRINRRAGEISKEHGENSDEYKAFKAKYFPIYQKLDAERKKLQGEAFGGSGKPKAEAATPKPPRKAVSDEKVVAAFNRSVENVKRAQAEVDKLKDAHWSDPRVTAAEKKRAKALEAATLLRQAHHAVDREAFLRAAGEYKKAIDKADAIDEKAREAFERSSYNAFNLPEDHPINKLRDEARTLRRQAKMGPGNRMNAAYYGEPATPGKLTSDGGGEVHSSIPSGLPRGGAKSDLKEFLDGSDVVMAFNPKGFSRFISEGEAKNGFHSDTGGIKVGKGGYLDGRRRGESNVLGIPSSADAEDRPVYAALEHPDRAKSLQGGSGNQMSNYGGIQVVFNPSVKDRATFTVGDSLDYNSPRRIMASPVRDPAAPVRTEGKGKDKNVDLKIGPERHSGNMEIVSGYEGDTRVTPSYVEAQIHGGLKASDIKEVRYYRGHDIPSSTRRLLEEQGVKIVEMPPKMGELRLGPNSPNFKDINATELE